MHATLLRCLSEKMKTTYNFPSILVINYLVLEDFEKALDV